MTDQPEIIVTESGLEAAKREAFNNDLFASLLLVGTWKRLVEKGMLTIDEVHDVVNDVEQLAKFHPKVKAFLENIKDAVKDMGAD